MADDYKKIEEAYTGARDNARELLDTLLNIKNANRDTDKFAQNLANTLKSQTTAAEKLSTLAAAREDYIKNQIQNQKAVNKDLVKELDTYISIEDTQTEIKRLSDKNVKTQSDLNDIIDQQNTALRESLGYSSELADLFAAGGVMALGAKAFTDGIEAAKTAFTGTYDTALDLYKTVGLTAGEAAGLAGSILSYYKRGYVRSQLIVLQAGQLAAAYKARERQAQGTARQRRRRAHQGA